MSNLPQGFLPKLEFFAWKLLRFLSRIFKSLWLFFPSILFVCLAMWCFWTLGQGKDLIVAFAENARAKLFFFVAIAFWVYATWYSSRIISYIKKSKQRGQVKWILQDHPESFKKNLENENFFEIPDSYLSAFPRMLGIACFLVIELAVMQSPLLGEAATLPGRALLYFLLGLLISLQVDDMLSKWSRKQPTLARTVFYVLLGLFVVVAITVRFMFPNSILSLFWLLILLHLVFLFYINLRRIQVEVKEIKENLAVKEPSWLRQQVYKIMDFFRIPRGETGYFLWFNIICASGLIIYILTIWKLGMSWLIGPLPVVLLAFGVLLGFGNIVTGVSVKTKVNLHLLILIIAFAFGSKETHFVRTVPLEQGSKGIYSQRQDIKTYFTNWIDQRAAAIDSAKDGYPVYFVLANGGASRSGYWTASVLGKLEDETIGKPQQFSRHLFCLSGTSGGGVGVATFFSLLHESKKLPPGTNASFTEAGKEFLKQDYLTHTLAHMLGPDYFKYIFHINNRSLSDRTGALEESFEEGARRAKSTLKTAMDVPFSSLVALNDQAYDLPVLCINTTRMQDGNPGVVTNIKLVDTIFNNRVDVVSLLNDSLDIRLSSASILGARFPYISPAGRIDEPPVGEEKKKVHYFVDGGYFDNSGAGVVQEMIREMFNITRFGSDSLLKRRVGKLQIMVLHVTNSPVGNADIKEVSPIKNDLMAPILTIVGAYDMQTTVNDRRLQNFLKDMDRSGVYKSAAYWPIHLYRETREKDAALQRGESAVDAPYAMNWFISDTTLRRMDKRLNEQPRLNLLIQLLKQNK